MKKIMGVALIIIGILFILPYMFNLRGGPSPLFGVVMLALGWRALHQAPASRPADDE
jgi:membrane-bound ClpP family serine protease